MSELLFKKKAISGLVVALKANRSLADGRRVVRTKKNPLNNRRLTRLINFFPHSVEDRAQLIRIERDSRRSAFIGLFRFMRSGFLSYLLLPSGIRVGEFLDINYSGVEKTINFHSAQTRGFSRFCIKPLLLHSKGSIIHNLEFRPLTGFKLCRSAGVSAVLEAVSCTLGVAKILLPSGKFAFLPVSSYAVSSNLSNEHHYNIKLRKAGQSAWAGTRCLTRGVAMNPVDHPHGGGEGKTSGGRPSVSFSAVLTKGFKTIKYKKKKKLTIIKRRFEVSG